MAAMLAWSLAALPIAAQSAGAPERWSELADTIFRTYGTDDGLPSSSVMAFAEDGDGFLWIGTQSGLARWDGYHFHVYRSDPADPGALADDFIWCLQRDSQGRLWVGTNGGRVSRYDKKTDRFVTFSLGPSDQGSVPIRSLAEDGAGGMWVGSDRGLDHLGADGHVLSYEQHDGSDPGGLPGEQVRALMRDRAGGLWVGTNGGLVHREKGSAKFSGIPLQSAGGEALPIRGLLETSDGRIWIGTNNHGAYIFDSSGKIATAIEGAGASGLSGQNVSSLVEASPGEVWLGTGSGIFIVNSAARRIKRLRHDPARPTSLPHDIVFSLYHDHSGLLWTGTYSGLGLHDPAHGGILTAFGGAGPAQGMTGADVGSVLEAENGKVWVGYFAGGADVLNPTGQTLTTLRPDPKHPQTSLPQNRIFALAESKNGEMYLGTGHGLYRADAEGGGLKHIPLSKEEPDSQIMCLLSERSGLWAGTYGEGLVHIDYGAGASRRYVNGWSGKWISAIAPAENGGLWVGTYQGLYLFDPLSERIQQVLPDPRVRSSSGGLISSLLKDQRGRMWVGTVGGGVAVTDGEDADGRPRFHQIGMAEGLPNLNVDALVEDKAGTIWASAGTGLIININPDTLVIHVFRRADGVGIQGFVMNAGTATSEGELLFGGDGGLAIIRPDRLKPRAWHPPVVVTDLRVGGRQIPSQAFDSADDNAPLAISPGANSLSVEFAALDYSAPDRNRYAYRLEGYEKSWVETDATRRLASYTNLPPGRYKLHLRGSNRDGVWSDKTLNIPIRVLPAWYQTVQFRMAMAALAVLGIWLLVRSRTEYLRHRQFVLENQVAERTAELKHSNNQLEARTTELGQSLQQVAESRAKVASLLDTSGQGFLSFGADLIIDPDCSRACASMLGGPPEGQKADAILFPEDAGKSEMFRNAASGALFSTDPFKRDLLLSLLPGTLQRRGRLLKVEYRGLDNGHVMVVLTDVTEEHRLSKKVESERLRLEMIVAAVTESRDFFDAIESFRQFSRRDLAQILVARAAPLSVHQEISREIHTLKGTLAQFSLEATPKMLHGLEERLSELGRRGEALTTGDIVELVLSVDFHSTLETDLAALRDTLGDEFLDQGKGVFLPLSQATRLREVAERLLAGESLDNGSAEVRDLFVEFRNLDKIALADALAVYGRVVVQVARRLDKEVAGLSIDGGEDLWLDPEYYGAFLHALVHVFRNAVVHGIEDPDERLAKGKDPAGKVDCVIRRQGPGFTLTIVDDGAGVDTDALLEKAVSLGLMSEVQAEALPHDEAIALIFADNLSVRDRADELAGRGIGLAAVRAETRALGGEVSVTSALGQGTLFHFFFPSAEKHQGDRIVGADSA
jgi:ligand-binding sensor domain-containing protein/signal transduction histidine kinase